MSRQFIQNYFTFPPSPMPDDVAIWIESLPMVARVRLASAILNQCDRVFQDVPKLSVMRPTIEPDEAS